MTLVIHPLARRPLMKSKMSYEGIIVFTGLIGMKTVEIYKEWSRKFREKQC